MNFRFSKFKHLNPKKYKDEKYLFHIFAAHFIEGVPVLQS